jgi:hypothetical protein
VGKRVDAFSVAAVRSGPIQDPNFSNLGLNLGFGSANLSRSSHCNGCRLPREPPLFCLNTLLTLSDYPAIMIATTLLYTPICSLYSVDAHVHLPPSHRNIRTITQSLHSSSK